MYQILHLCFIKQKQFKLNKMEKNKKDQTPQPNGPGNQKQNQANPKTSGANTQKTSPEDSINERVRFENEPQEIGTRKEESNRKPGTNQPNQGYKPTSNEGLNQGAKQGNDPVTNKRANQDTETINK